MKTPKKKNLWGIGLAPLPPEEVVRMFDTYGFNRLRYSESDLTIFFPRGVRGPTLFAIEGVLYVLDVSGIPKRKAVKEEANGKDQDQGRGD